MKNYDVDKYGGGVAWLDADGAAHVAPSGVPTQALTATATRTDAAFAPRAGATWNPAWQLSKPYTDAQLLIKSKKKVVRTLTPPHTAPPSRSAGTAPSRTASPPPPAPTPGNSRPPPRTAQAPRSP
ncbi:hypothetical protein [Streptomyces sp. NPDC047453]|uniref:hypothetical protein n=1 Tax=Streptomyces sp. NPDC047453 TaxID=3154812 RepID=UPI0033ED8405